MADTPAALSHLAYLIDLTRSAATDLVTRTPCDDIARRAQGWRDDLDAVRESVERARIGNRESMVRNVS